MNDLASLSLHEVRALWRRKLNIPVPEHKSPGLLARALSYHLQARAKGALSRAAKRRLEELAERFIADRAFSPDAADRLKAGSVLVREWNGRTYAVTTTETGFLYDGRAFESLSAVARDITGVRWSGPRFFKLTSKAGDGLPS
ncbi:MAG: DUF2924 domain-containing protein [Caulobacterales bacterium]